jgi:hypothetical protein
MEKPKTKACPGCGRKELPTEAFRKDKGRYDGLDSYCKRCRSQQAKANRPRENERWKKRRKALAEDGKTPSVVPKDHVNARRTAQRKNPPKRCLIRGCANRGDRHHFAGYDREHWNDVIPLCGPHHAKQHVLERARRRTGPSYL